MRELIEELGLVAEHDIAEPLMLTRTTTVGLASGHVDVSLWYVVHASKHRRIRYDESEFNGMRWFQHSDVPLHSDPHLARFLAKLASCV